ncbi:VOC family protein [Actinotalea sp. K2]|nr:VOC family protein [Actinotalea sp. K2]
MSHGDITHVDIPVTDTRRAQAFYGDLFGWDIREVAGFEGYPMWQAPNGALSGGLAPRDASFTQPRSYIHVDSIDEALTIAEANGGRVVQPRQAIDGSSGWAVLEDTEGNEMGVYEQTPATDR